MTIRFAAATTAASTHPVVRRVCAVRLSRPANDNPSADRNDKLVYEALRHFAQHGIAAARHAKGRAEEAFFAGDREAYDWWLGICRQLDRRMARDCAAGIDSAEAADA